MKRPRLARLAVLSIMLAAGLSLAACQHESPQPWQLTDIAGHMPDLALSLTDDQGKAVTAADYRGKIALLYFGYTHCPDVCPLTLAQLHVVMQKLGTAADHVRILFVSVDPTRDTPAILHAYVAAFDPRAVGLTGAAAEIEALTKRYRAAFSREPGKADGSYEVSHSSGIYIFDANGKARLLATPTDPQDKMVHDLQLLLNTGSGT
ncbi:SCO family protein [Dyella acidiphila]|uniref:SCO family protein n=1 Tax=Dyella acidiphila TaxID=2775866 RepID=A0ABR9GCB4_9GAMM|nr:SCO family protein [Dyella acidiphila]MBE1161680.1 SCO family protein [Dyella acidiphila]